MSNMNTGTMRLKVDVNSIRPGDILNGFEVSHVRPCGKGVTVWVSAPNVNGALVPRRYGDLFTHAYITRQK